MMIRTAVFLSLLSWASAYAEGDSEAITITRRDSRDTIAGAAGHFTGAINVPAPKKKCRPFM